MLAGACTRGERSIDGPPESTQFADGSLWLPRRYISIIDLDQSRDILCEFRSATTSGRDEFCQLRV